MNQIKILTLVFGLIFQISLPAKQKPTVFTLGDSTVKNGQGNGAGGLWGWGDPFQQYFDTAKVVVKNRALGGTSSRTFQTKGLWDEVLKELKKGDFVLMQFGHNDGGAINDTLRARGTSLSQEYVEPLKEVLITKLKINPFSSEIIRKLIIFRTDSISIERKHGMIHQIILTEQEIDYLLLQFEAIVNANFEAI